MKILVLPADGIGPEIVAAAVTVLSAADQKFKLNTVLQNEIVGFESLKQFGTTLRPEIIAMAKTFDGIILGTQSHAEYPPPEDGGLNISASFRVGLDLYANIRPARTREGLGLGKKGLDLVIMREATEGFYPDRNCHKGWGEVMLSPDMAISTRKITRYCCDRIARRAFELATGRRKKVTAVHKANSFHMTDGLFLECVENVAKEFPSVEIDDILIDAMTAHLVRHPERFDVIVATNFYGDIISDLATELSGSLGLGGSIMVGDSLCAAQAQHGSAPDIAGLNIANPVAMILSLAMLLEWGSKKFLRPELGLASKSIETAVDRVLLNSNKRTPDLGGLGNTDSFANAVAAELQ
ncbi:MAG: 3-isopropylmalate dehydrogenase [Magnetovibrio sp.]|nr:3-isopropylmalate dehydrogenase [Magnetovibrio sp.]